MSIGAITSACSGGYVVENETYEGSERGACLIFWNYLSKESFVGTNPRFLNLGGITGLQSIGRSHRESCTGDTILLEFES